MTVTCVLASANPHKVSELQSLLGDGPWQLRSLRDYPQCTLPPEVGSTFSANACAKAEAVTVATGEWAISDDSGLVVDVLSGAPGIFSARYGGTPTDDAKNIARLLVDLINVGPPERSAHFVCVLALARPGVETQWVCGVCSGVVSTCPRGAGGFGYDPIFYLPALRRTMAELTAEEKHAISHRGQAARSLRKMLLDLCREKSETSARLGHGA
ncbi:MAG: RdgB/HAM1 family non-canonical purine NTP pyrophosphatase [Deltaproteobacteria bacterium]|nr:RdgB/HAM1 family non-canonical purine NTP pyrophosphatase [Deltaproteobacteria bacterium]